MRLAKNWKEWQGGNKTQLCRTWVTVGSSTQGHGTGRHRTTQDTMIASVPNSVSDKDSVSPTRFRQRQRIYRYLGLFGQVPGIVGAMVGGTTQDTMAASVPITQLLRRYQLEAMYQGLLYRQVSQFSQVSQAKYPDRDRTSRTDKSKRGVGERSLYYIISLLSLLSLPLWVRVSAWLVRDPAIALRGQPRISGNRGNKLGASWGTVTADPKSLRTKPYDYDATALQSRSRYIRKFRIQSKVNRHINTKGETVKLTVV